MKKALLFEKILKIAELILAPEKLFGKFIGSASKVETETKEAGGYKSF